MPIDAQPIATFGALEGIIPVGASTFTLTFGPYTDALGVNLSGSFSGKLYPVDQVTGKRTKVVHIATGQVILPQDIPITVTAGTASVGPLPHTGQASMTPFFYRVEWALTSGKPSPGNKTFAAPAASGSTIDFDLLDTSTTPDVWVSPTVASVNGKTGAVVLSASDVGAQPAGSYATSADVTAASTADRARANHTGTQPASTVTGLATVATSGSYTDLSAKPTIPTVGAAGAGATVALSSTDATVTNARTPTTHAATHASGGSDPVTPAAIGADAAGAATSAQAFAIQRANHTGTQAATTITGLATVATSGAYADLSGKPTIPGDATTTTKGIVQLAGDLAGTAAAPTVPGLAGKLSTTDARVAVPGPAALNYFYVNSPHLVSTSAALGNGTLRMTPWMVYSSLHIDRLGAEVTAAGDVGSKLRLGIFADNGSGYPGALVVDAGTINGDSVAVQFTTIDTTLPPGLYWVGAVVQGVTTTQPTVRTANAQSNAPVLIPLGTSAPAAAGAVLGLGLGSYTGALPASVPAAANASGVMPRFIARVAA